MSPRAPIPAYPQGHFRCTNVAQNKPLSAKTVVSKIRERMTGKVISMDEKRRIK